MSTTRNRIGPVALALALTTALAGCVGGQPTNRSLNSVHQPVVERTSYTLDINTLPGGGVSVSEQRRMAGWFDSLDLGYGDKVALDDPARDPATHDAVQAVLAGHGMSLAEGAPITAGSVAPGIARLVIMRTTAAVPGCPDWSTHNDGNGNNATSTNYGCAVNSNLAAMVANKEDLVHGQSDDGRTTVMTSNKAIQAYRDNAPSGMGGATVKKVNTSTSAASN
ncbi:MULTISPECIES: CpaD family pilus assembly protein [unclassified Novosphingobium]|uniref:CpaD family pilus assembly protein n=1 Tax=unclassified Novosphingobium TaxID=2644732 RepID=UPI000D30D0EB|nr:MULTISPECIES: CpaD family pilus assembly protein [unclassified Novosphingobium]PTR12477.1 pilus assembly protein CpaD [Novosphingobium sp. GV055]PUB05878.1 pilus assembly protein CpaD [Novosphingobium sp. GV061]PUB22111.1 pilus assembly protein CpaD [Novosphingobium sp. GV079]PUB43884.1 pilus assembly protein CpaD [Novosphingobium sp. GV027]